MMRNALVLSFCVYLSLCSKRQDIQTKQLNKGATYLKGQQFEGVLFGKGSFFLPPPELDDTYKRCELSPAEIDDAEILIANDVKISVGGKITDVVVKQNIKDYWRQYGGYTNPKGEKLVLVSGLRKKHRIKFPIELAHVILVRDGGNGYWQAFINLSEKQIKVFLINSYGG